METLALLLLVPLVWPFVAKMLWKREITLREMALNLLLVAGLVAAGWAGSRYAQSADTEIWNGQVVSKARKTVPCSHAYKCNCVTQKDAQGRPYESCSTCYDHSQDYDWMVSTTVDDIEIRRVDRQGTQEPPRFTLSRPGDPVALAKPFTNYVKAAPDSLFNDSTERENLDAFRQQIPPYPKDVFDYHYVNRVLPVGVSMPDVSEWNRDIALRLRDLGPSKQVNWVIVVTNQKDPRYAAALRSAWLGGKKNDVVVILGAPAYPELKWARVVSWTDAEHFKVKLRDELQDLKTVDRTAVLDALERNVRASFTRKHMRDFDYLANEIQPPLWLMLLLFIAGGLGSVALSFVLAINKERG